MIPLILLALIGCAILASSPNNSVAETVGAVLMVAPIMAIPVGYAMGYLH